MALSKEELAELAELEKEESKRAAELADATARQHLDALRARKRLASKHGVHGRDFVVVETTRAGNFAVRRPKDVEIDALAENVDDRAAQEAFALAVTLEPDAAAMQALMSSDPGVVNVVIPAAYSMLTRVREEEAKK